MPRPPRHRWTQAGRMVRVLRYLTDHGDSADSTEIRRGVPGYGGKSGHRLWRRDLNELRCRNLVALKEPGEQMSSRVELVRYVKPQHLFLTVGEHDVLAEVEDRFRRTRPASSPLPEGSAGEVDEFARLTRYLEERPGQELTYTQVGQALGLGHQRLTELLEQITVESENDDYVGESPEHPALAWIEYWSPDVEPLDGRICAKDVAAVLGAEVAATFDPHERTGQLGFWAYSAAETDDRLELIDHALREPGLTPAQRDRLRSARQKLFQWKAQLPAD